MRQFLVLASLFFVFFSSCPAFAQNPQFKKGGSPTCRISQSGSVTCSGTLTGLGNEDLKTTLTVSGFAVYKCQNKGGNLPAGQNKVLVGPVTTPTVIPADRTKNGNLFFSSTAVLTPKSTVSGTEAGCPNPNFTGVQPALTVTDISLVIEQPVGTEIFTCTAGNQNGLSGTVTLVC